MRAFLGISIPEDLKKEIVAFQRRFSKFDIKFVEPENLHFNMKFFSEIGEEQISELKVLLEEVCKQFEPFEIEIKGVGAFPNPIYIRVLWLGVSNGRQELTGLAETIQESIKSIGFQPEKFTPHMTLGRVRTGREKDEIKRIMDSDDFLIGRMKVEEITLFQSKLTPSGPRYDKVFSVHL